MLSIGSREVVRIELRGEVPCQELDDSAVLFLLEGGVEHLSVFRQVVGLVLGATGLVSVSYLGDFTGYEFLSGGSCKVAVVCGTYEMVAMYRLTASESLSPQKAR